VLDRRFLRENPDAVRAALARRGVELDLDRVLSLDRRIVEIQAERDRLKAEQNRLSKSVPTLKEPARSEAIAASKELGRRIAPLDAEAAELERALEPLLLEIPNVPDPDVPSGLDPSANVEVRRVGTPRAFDFPPKDHLDVAGGLLDVARAVKLAGTRTYFLRGDLVLLELAVLRFALDLVARRGYLPLSPPVIVGKGAMEGTGYLPAGREQAYELTRDDGWLIGTSEVPITAMHADEVLDEARLPLRYAGYSACFRREAGTYGKDTRGVYRVHQFVKVEQVVIAPADPALEQALHEEILANAEDVLKALRLPYRVVALCAGDMGRSAAFTYDIETWMPGRNGYGETHSASRYHDYQARRLKLRYRDAGRAMRFCYTLNNTVVASPRILVAILENYQRSDGSVDVPEALVPLVGKERISAATG
jgi:seryl-tRNA synthetase